MSFPELEGRGKRAILRTAEEVQAEQSMVDAQHASMPDDQDTGIPASQHPSDLENQRPGRRAGYIKVTYRISPQALNSIDDTKRLLRREYGVKVSLEDIAEQAILAAYRDLLENQQTSFLVTQLSGKPEKSM